MSSVQSDNSPGPKLTVGDDAPRFELRATDGTAVGLGDVLAKHDAVVVMFICNHCPYVKAYIPRLIALQNEFEGRVKFVAINSNDATNYPEDRFEAMVGAVEDWGMSFPYVHDESQAVARAYGAERTPEIFVLDRAGVCRYEGGIDNNFQNPEAVTDRPLHEALSAVIEAVPVARPKTYAIGCTIKWKTS